MLFFLPALLFLPWFSGLFLLAFLSLLFVGYLEEFTSPYLIKKLHRPGNEPGTSRMLSEYPTSRPTRLVDVGLELNVPNNLQGRFPIIINVIN